MPGHRAGHRGKRWCFTLNNHTEDESRHIVSFITPANCKFAVVGVEKSTSDTPHLQGLHPISRNKSLNLRTTSTVLKKGYSSSAWANLALAQRKTEADLCKLLHAPEQHICYLKDWTSKTSPKTTWKNIELLFPMRTLSKNMRLVCASEKQKQWVLQNMQTNLSAVGSTNFFLTELMEEPDDRKIIWYCDQTGSSGKT